MLQNTGNLKTCYKFLREVGLTHAGTIGMLANIYAESKCDPLCVEAQLIKRYKQEHFLKWDYELYDENTYKQYWSYLDAGAISRKEFISPRQYTGAPHQYGAGICQWTAHDRKEKWLSLAKDDCTKLTDLGLQLNLLYWELKNTYQDVYRVLHSTINVQIATNYVLRNFEAPANPASLLNERMGYAAEIGALFNGQNGGEKVSALSPDRVIQVAKNEIGYLEKRSNANLDSKTANAGQQNYTKYWRDLKPSFQGEAWCDCFVDWCFFEAYGKTDAQKLECGGFGEFYTPSSAQCYKDAGRYDKTPKIGDQIFFKNSSRICHTGIVYAVANGRVYTIEGNTSGGSEVIPNGGGVCAKSYEIGNPRIAGYGHPRYNASASPAQVKPSPSSAKPTVKKGSGYMFEPKDVSLGSKGASVILLQEILYARKLYTGKITGKADAALVNGINAYQSSRRDEDGTELGTNGKNDGCCGNKMWADIIGL